MSVGIYKPGQGVYVRWCTAIGFGLLIIAGIGWLWNEMTGIGRKPSEVKAATTVTAHLVTWGKLQNHPAKDFFGTLKEASLVAGTNGDKQIRMVDAMGHVFTLTQPEFDAAAAVTVKGAEKAVAGSTRWLSLAEMEKVSVAGDQVTFTGQPSFTYRNRNYIQAGVAGGLLLGFAILFFWLLNKPNIVEFMIATEAEMRKVNWPTKREITGSTWVVICGMLLMAMILLVVDVMFSELFINIKVLEGTSIIRNWLGSH